MMDTETRDLLVDLDEWLEERNPELAMRAGFRARIKKVLAAKEIDTPSRKPPESLGRLQSECWLQGYDAASEAAIEAEVTK